MESKIKQVIEEIRPLVQSDGGDIEFVSFDTKTKIVQIRFHGACVGCPISHVTLYQGIEQRLKDNCPEIAGVETVE